MYFDMSRWEALMRFIFVEKVWHMGALPSKDCPGSETKLGRKWSSDFGKDRMALGTNNSQAWDFLLQSKFRIRAQLKLNWPPLSWETRDCSNSVEMAPVNQCSPVQYFRIHSFQVWLHSDNSKDCSFAARRFKVGGKRVKCLRGVWALCYGL